MASARKMVEVAKRSADEQGRQHEILVQKQKSAGEAVREAAKRVAKAQEQAAKIAAENGSKSAQKAANDVVKQHERERQSAERNLQSLISARRSGAVAARKAAEDAAKAVEIGAERERRAHLAAAQAARSAFRQAASERMKAIGEGMGRAGNALTFGATAPALGLGAWAVKRAAELENAQMMLKNIMGSAKSANAEITKLNKTAELPGLGQLEVYRTSAQFQTLKLTADEAREAIKQFGNLNALGGGDAANFSEITRQFTQIVSLGKVTAENLNVIKERSAKFNDALLGAFGTSNGEKIQKAIESGKLTMRQFVDGIISEMAKLERAQSTSTDQWQSFGDKMGAEAARLGKEVIPEMKKLGPEVISSFREMVKAGLPVVKEVLPEITKGIKYVGKAFRDLSPDQKELIAKFFVLGAAGGPVLKAASAFFEVGKGVVSIIKTGTDFARWVTAKVLGYGAVARGADAAALAEARAAGAGGGLGSKLGVLKYVPHVAAGYAGWEGGKFLSEKMDENARAHGLENSFEGTTSGQELRAQRERLAQRSTPEETAAQFRRTQGREPTAKQMSSWRARYERDAWNRSQQAEDQARGYVMPPKTNAQRWHEVVKAQNEARRTQEAKDLAQASRAGAAVTSALGKPSVMDLSGDVPKTSGRTKASDLPLLTGDIISGFAKGIDTPAGSASCATFASRLIARFTKGVTDQGGAVEAGAKNLVNRFLAVGARQVAPKKGQSAGDAARAGDLVYYYGKDYGKAKDKYGKGYHVAVATGRGMALDSSGGKDNRVRKIGADAVVLRLPKSKLAGFQGAGAEIESLARQLTPAEERAKAFSEGLARLKENLAGLTDGRKRYAESLGLSLSAYKILAPEEQAAAKRQIDMATAQERAAAAQAAFSQSMHEKRKDLKRLTGTDKDRYAIDMFDGKRYGDLSEKNRLKVDQQKAFDERLKEARDQNKKLGRVVAEGFALRFRDPASARAAAAESERSGKVKDLVKSLDSQLSKERGLSSAGKAIIELRQQGIKITIAEAFAIARKGNAIDAEIGKEARLARASEMRSRQFQEALHAGGRYRESMLDLQKRLGETRAQSDSRRVGELAAAFGTSPSGSGLFAGVMKTVSGLEKARTLIRFQREISEVERLRDVFRSAADGIGEGFRSALGDLVRTDFPSFFSSLGGLVDGFVSRLGAAVIQQQVDRVIGDVIGSIGRKSGGGGNAGSVIGAFTSLIGGQRAGTGHVEAGHLYRVNEEKTEGFRPYSSGEIVPLQKGGGGGGGRTSNIHITINVPGATNYQSASQLGTALGKQIASDLKQYA